jgi:SAM-dependent methyltransferase
LPRDPVQRRETCRLCGGRELTPVLSLTPTPPANGFVPEDRLAEPQPAFPLDVFFCEDCAHVQLLDVVDPAVLFEDYVYVSGTSQVFVEHFRHYAGWVSDRFRPDPEGLVVDVGSNDGTLLGFFKDRGHRVLGVDPARDIARRATETGIETVADFFTPALAAGLRDRHGPAAVVTANNVFAHADDLAGMAEGVRALLAPEGVFAFEVSYLADVVRKTLFDTIYHEHLAYHALKPLVPFLARHGLEAIDALRVESHGGSLRVVAQPTGGPRPVDPSVGQMLALEDGLGLDRAETFRDFAGRIEVLRLELSSLLRGFKAEGRAIAGFGAPAKATTLMYHFGLGPDVIDFIVDDSPLKQGLYSPGMHIPILAPDLLYERRPDYVVVLAWNFADAIMERHRAFCDAGGRFVVPVPTVKVV